MSDFVYIYKTSDGVRHEAEIGAPSRDAAFAALRERGIRPIKVIAKDGTRANGEMRGVRRRVVVAVALAAALIAAGGVFLLHRRPAQGPDAGTNSETVRQMVAVALARQEIPGDRRRIETAVTNLFKHAAEVYLARFAEPGRPLADDVETPAEADFRACLKDPVRVAANEFSEWIDLKRIVTGMKKELRAYLMGGGTVAQYRAELVGRQRQEIAYREKAETNLKRLLEEVRRKTGVPRPDRGTTGPKPDLGPAYDYWLKANARLKSMGIYELALPDALRSYQTTLDVQEE